jgi:hypothetical protein
MAAEQASSSTPPTTSPPSEPAVTRLATRLRPEGIELQTAADARSTGGTDQRGSVDRVPTQRRVGAPPSGDTGSCGIVTDQVGQPVNRAG